jgi:glycosyltransferase involved in cell wall biosynthesis
MKILRVIASTNPSHGGPIEGLRQSTSVFTELGHHTEVVTLDEPDSPWLANYPFPITALGRSSRLYSYSPRLLSWLRDNASRFDFVIQHALWNYTAYATGHALRNSPVPYFVFTHGMLDPWFRETYPLKHVAKQALWWLSEGPLLKNAKAVFFTSEEECRLARGVFWPYRAVEQVVGYGTADIGGDAVAQIADFHNSVPALGERPFLLFLSRIHPKKGCDLLVRAFAKIAAKHPHLDLVIAGPDQTGWCSELRAIADAENVGGRIHWPGMLKGEAKWGAYRACEAFVLPSHQENFGIVVAEAMACGKPALITNKVNIWREVEQSGSGLVVDDDQPGIDSLLERFLSPGCDATAMGQAARRTFLEKFEIRGAATSLLSAITRKLPTDNPGISGAVR